MITMKLITNINKEVNWKEQIRKTNKKEQTEQTKKDSQ